MKMENMLKDSSPALTTPTPHKHTDADLLDILKGNEKLTPLEAFAKKTYGTVLKRAVEDDEKQYIETKAAENFIRPAALSSIAVLRAVGAMRKTNE
jgi:hypothetical protein